MYVCETIILREKESSRIRDGQIDNFWGLFGKVNQIECHMHGLELCEVKKDNDERVLRQLEHAERRENSMIAKRVYGKLLNKLTLKNWIDSVSD